jgi:hypothetical protein
MTPCNWVSCFTILLNISQALICHPNFWWSTYSVRSNLHVTCDYVCTLKDILYFSETLVPTIENTMSHSQKNTVVWIFQCCRPILDIWSGLFPLNFLLRFCIYGISSFSHACCMYRRSRPLSFIYLNHIYRRLEVMNLPIDLPFFPSLCYFHHFMSCSNSSRDSDWLRAGRQRGRSSSPGRVKNFLFSTSSRPVLQPTQPPIQCVPWALSPEVKQLGRETDQSPPNSAEVKKIWIYIFSLPYPFMA